MSKLKVVTQFYLKSNNTEAGASGVREWRQIPHEAKKRREIPHCPKCKMNQTEQSASGVEKIGEHASTARRKC